MDHEFVFEGNGRAYCLLAMRKLECASMNPGEKNKVVQGQNSTDQLLSQN